MGRRGRKRQLEVETEYWLLLKAGVGTVEERLNHCPRKVLGGRPRPRSSTPR